MDKSIFVTGADGLVGSRFVDLKKNCFKIVPSDINHLDITDQTSVKKYFQNNNFDAVIHFAAWTDVGRAEEQRNDKRGLCWKVNVEGTRNLVEAINPAKTHFIHISTDMVFPSTRDNPGPYSDDHLVKKDSRLLTWYGFTKAEAEKQVMNKLGKRATIVRLIYPVRAEFDQKLDYLRKPLKLFDEGKLYPLFDDQQISITFIDEACDVLEKIIKEGHYGIFHASSSDTTTPYELVSYALRKIRRVNKNKIKSVSLDKYIQKGGDPRRYPKFGGLSVKKTEKKLGVKFRLWREIVDILVAQGLEKS